MKKLLLLVIFVVAPSLSFAQAFQVTDIRVEGLQRISAGTVFAALPIRVGDTITRQDWGDATRALFRTGYFADIEIGRDGNILVLNLTERPSISEIIISGNKAIKTEDLLEGMADNGLAEGQIFKQAPLEGLAQELQRQYHSQGRYSASVKTEVVDLPRNQVRLNIKVDEGSEARIKHINIVGNEVFSDEELLELFELKSTGWFSWINGNDKYASTKLTGDLERLESYYRDRGYLEFDIESAPVSISPDKESLYITVNVTEGDVYTINKIELAGDPVLEEDVVRRFIVIQEGKTFSQILMTTSEDYITQVLGNEGYTFAETRGIPELNREDKTVDVSFFVDPGKRAYVRRINFRGNSRTSDEVLRREMRQMEGGSASTALIEQSKLRLNQTGYFREVQVETNEVPGTADQIDVDYTVEEQPSGNVTFQLGYARQTDFLIGIDVRDNNFLGSGKQVGIGVNTNSFQTSLRLNYTDPYFTPDGVSRGFGLSYSKRDFGEFNTSSFDTEEFGADVTFGYPLSETQRVSASFQLRHTEISASQFSVQEILSSPILFEGVPQQFITQTEFLDSMLEDFNLVSFAADDPVVKRNPEGFIDRNGDEFDNFIVRLAWVSQSLNRGILATRGYSQRLFLDVAVPGSDLEYYKLDYEGQYFQPLTQRLTLRLRTRLGYAEAYGSTEEVPFFEHFRAGGFGSVRGFERNTLGPRSTPAENFAISTRDLNGDGAISVDEQFYVLCEFEDVLCDASQVGQLRSISQQQRRDDSFGGNVLVEASAEVIFPLPFIKDQRSIQSAFFIDTGGVFDTDCGDRQLNCDSFSVDGLSASFGFGLTWISGFGPLTFSLSKPLKEQEFDDTTSLFDFTLGTSF